MILGGWPVSSGRNVTKTERQVLELFRANSGFCSGGQHRVEASISEFILMASGNGFDSSPQSSPRQKREGEFFGAFYPGRRSQTRFALGNYISGFQPFPTGATPRCSVASDAKEARCNGSDGEKRKGRAFTPGLFDT